MNQNILRKPDKNASEISDLKDSVVVLHKHQNCHFMISGLLSCQLSQRLSGKLLSFSSVGVYLTQIVGQQNTDDMIKNLNQTRIRGPGTLDWTRNRLRGWTHWALSDYDILKVGSC